VDPIGCARPEISAHIGADAVRNAVVDVAEDATVCESQLLSGSNNFREFRQVFRQHIREVSIRVADTLCSARPRQDSLWSGTYKVQTDRMARRSGLSRLALGLVVDPQK